MRPRAWSDCYSFDAQERLLRKGAGAPAAWPTSELFDTGMIGEGGRSPGAAKNFSIERFWQIQGRLAAV
jgi:hypothetical protein